MPLLFTLPGNEAMSGLLRNGLPAESGKAEFRRFPDGESYVRIGTDPNGRQVMMVAALSHPDDKVLPLLYFAAAARDLGARSVGLIDPYLAYLRQDRRFKSGEALTSCTFAHLLGGAFDWLVTVEPHLHRLSSLRDIYSIPTLSVHAAPLLVDWIKDQVRNPVLIGPDAESEQWVSAIAERAAVPYVILKKSRRGDYEVSIAAPDFQRWHGCTPVIVDDIISTGRTMIEVTAHLRRAAFVPPVCLAVHGIFSGPALHEMRAAGIERIVTCNTMPHATNDIDISSLLAAGVKTMLEL